MAVLRLAGLAAIEPMELVAPLGFIFGGLLLGLIFEKIVLAKVRSVVSGAGLARGDIVAQSVRGVTTLWFGVAGIYLATTRLPLDRPVENLLRDALLVAVILSGALVLARIAADLVSAYAGKVHGLPSSSLLTYLTRIIILALGVLIILQSLGIAIAPLMAALGVGGLAAALALQETLANLLSGIMIMASRQLRPGDFVSLDTGEEGYVEDVTWRNTTIRALSNNMIVVPNSKLGGSTITNYYQPEKQMSVVIPIGVSYDSDLAHVEDVTIQVATEVMSEIEGGVPEFEPMVRYNNFGAYSIDFSAIMQTREVTEQYRIKHEFIKRLHERYHHEGIEIPFPVTTVYTDGNAPAVPPRYPNSG